MDAAAALKWIKTNHHPQKSIETCDIPVAMWGAKHWDRSRYKSGCTAGALLSKPYSQLHDSRNSVSQHTTHAREALPARVGTISPYMAILVEQS